MYTIYCLINQKGKIYIGQTSDIKRRLLEHNDLFCGKKLRYTRNKGPWELFYQEEVLTKKEALRREKELKSHKGRDWLRKSGALAQR